jgi:hypothetical protein
MKKLPITKEYAHALECEGHLELIFDNTTNVSVVVYGKVITTDGKKHPFTLLVTEQGKVKEALAELKQSYSEVFADMELLEPLYI